MWVHRQRPRGRGGDIGLGTSGWGRRVWDIRLGMLGWGRPRGDVRVGTLRRLWDVGFRMSALGRRRGDLGFGMSTRVRWHGYVSLGTLTRGRWCGYVGVGTSTWVHCQRPWGYWPGCAGVGMLGGRGRGKLVLYFLSKNNISRFVHCCVFAGGKEEDTAVADVSSEHKEEAKDAAAVQEHIGGK